MADYASVEREWMLDSLVTIAREALVLRRDPDDAMRRLAKEIGASADVMRVARERFRMCRDGFDGIVMPK